MAPVGDATLFAAMRAGALGYLFKGANQAQIVTAIMSAAQGEAVFGPTIARRVADFSPHSPRRTSCSGAPSVVVLGVGVRMDAGTANPTSSASATTGSTPAPTWCRPAERFGCRVPCAR
jgi:hypothetical protein